jgi:hypothetical protein
MNRIERAIVLAALFYMLVYIPYFFLQVYRIEALHADPSLLAIAIPHGIGMFLNFAAIITTFRDLYLRPFPAANDKLTWGLLILMTGGIGWLVYLFRYALKPRNAPSLAIDMKSARSIV